MRNLKKIIGVLAVTMLVTTASFNYKANASTDITKDNKITLEESYLNKFSSEPKVQEVINKVEENGSKIQTTEYYCKVQKNSDGSIDKKMYTENEYIEELAKENFKNAVVPGGIQIMNVPIDQNFGWIKLRLECYSQGGKDFMAAGFYNWLKLPGFSMKDVLAIGHDSSSTFDVQSAFAVFISPYSDINGSHQDTVVKHWGTASGSEKTSSTTGVAFKFNLISSTTYDPNDIEYPFGMMYVNGTVNGGEGSNLQVSYGHAQLSFDYNITDAVEFLANGGIKFKIKGFTDTVTVGDRYVP